MAERLIESVLRGITEVKSLDFSNFSIDNRQIWDSLDLDLKKEIIGKAEHISFSEKDYISLALYRDFKKTGERKNFENVYFEKRKKLSLLTVAECVENKDRFIPLIEEGIWSLLSEPSWVLPAHNSYIRDTEQLDTPLLARPVLDLFSCESAEILALVRAVLKSRLNPIITDDIEYVLRDRIVNAYITDSFWWMGGDGKLNNWSTWCTQNVLISSLSLESLDDKTRFKIIRQATDTLDRFIDSYESDGACAEGASYYHAAALTLFSALLLIEKATGRSFDEFYRNEKIRAMAAYIEDVHIAKDNYLNYADCSPKAGNLGAREFLFAKATGNEAMMHHAALDYMRYGFEEDDNSYNLYYKLIALHSFSDIKKEAERKVSIKKPSLKVFKESELAIYREGDITFAIKGGNNGESHNHNDVGSIILYAGSKPLLIDIGVETYTKTTFSKDRYTLAPMQSAYHNLVNFPPVMQKDGPLFRAKDVTINDSDAYFDLTGAYPETEGLKKYVRRIHFERSKRQIIVYEDIEAAIVPVLSLISVEKPEQKGHILEFDTFSIEFDSPLSFTLEEMDIKDARLLKAWPRRLYRSLLHLDGSIKWTISIK